MRFQLEKASKLGYKTPVYITVTTAIYKETLKVQIDEDKILTIKPDKDTPDDQAWMMFISAQFDAEERIEDYLDFVLKGSGSPMQPENIKAMSDLPFDELQQIYQDILQGVLGINTEDLSVSDDEKSRS